MSSREHKCSFGPASDMVICAEICTWPHQPPREVYSVTKAIQTPYLVNCSEKRCTGCWFWWVLFVILHLLMLHLFFSSQVFRLFHCIKNMGFKDTPPMSPFLQCSVWPFSVLILNMCVVWGYGFFEPEL